MAVPTAASSPTMLRGIGPPAPRSATLGSQLVTKRKSSPSMDSGSASNRVLSVSGYVADSDLGHRPGGTRGERRQLPLERKRQASRLGSSGAGAGGGSCW